MLTVLLFFFSFSSAPLRMHTFISLFLPLWLCSILSWNTCIFPDFLPCSTTPASAHTYTITLFFFSLSLSLTAGGHLALSFPHHPRRLRFVLLSLVAPFDSCQNITPSLGTDNSTAYLLFKSFFFFFFFLARLSPGACLGSINHHANYCIHGEQCWASYLKKKKKKVLFITHWRKHFTNYSAAEVVIYIIHYQRRKRHSNHLLK